LLRNILPESIVGRLQGGEKDISDAFASVSILFADIVNFTPLSQEVTSSELVVILNRIFSEFDDLSEMYGLEKIKTIGDAYMVASGLPERREDHAELMADMALSMQEVIRSIGSDLDRPLDVRIGINSGPVVAGVIGKRKFIYDLWGDTVNVASRMESHAVDGSIQVSESTYQLLKGKYLFEDRGVIHIKGKGDMRAFMLKSKLPVPA
jgi:adenylate cyclase